MFSIVFMKSIILTISIFFICDSVSDLKKVFEEDADREDEKLKNLPSFKWRWVSDFRRDQTFDIEDICYVQVFLSFLLFS